MAKWSRIGRDILNCYGLFVVVLDESVDLRLLQTETLRGFGVGSEEVHDKPWLGSHD